MRFLIGGAALGVLSSASASLASFSDASAAASFAFLGYVDRATLPYTSMAFTHWSMHVAALETVLIFS